MKKEIIVLLILFVLFFSFGCVNNKKSKVSSVANKTVGIVYYTYQLNGKKSNSMTLYKDEQGQVNIHLKNLGKYTMKDVNLRLISCIEPQSKNSHATSILPGGLQYFNFVLYNNISLPGENIPCDSTVRLYFMYHTSSYFDIGILNESFNGEPPAVSRNSDNELVSITYNLPDSFKIINDNRYINGVIHIKNIGLGTIDYYNFSKYSMNEITAIEIYLPKNFSLYSLGGYNWDGLKNCGVIEKNNVYIINSTNLKSECKGSLITMGVGAGNPGEIYLPITLEYNGKVNSEKLYRGYVNVYYGYSYDLFKFNLNLVSSSYTGGSSSSSGVGGAGGGGTIHAE